jgi:hypothetical protein
VRRNNNGGHSDDERPDPTFHASPKLAMEAAIENFAYTLLLSPDFSKPDALAVIDVKPGSPTFSQIGDLGIVSRIDTEESELTVDFRRSGGDLRVC